MLISIPHTRRGQVYISCFMYANINSMSRPIRIEFSGAFYHVTARGDRRENIYDDHNRVDDHNMVGSIFIAFEYMTPIRVTPIRGPRSVRIAFEYRPDPDPCDPDP